ncbi:DNA recombination protein RmuC [Deferribacterales bacterium RsTz2092]|nr:DNA recombination protein RmuC [Deferribacterales bacterium]
MILDILLIIGLLMVVGLYVFEVKKPKSPTSVVSQEEVDKFKTDIARMQAIIQEKETQLKVKDDKIAALEAAKSELERDKSAIETRLTEQEKNLKEKLQAFQNMHDELLKEFKAVSSETIKNQRDEVAKAQTDHLNTIISPFSAQLGNLKGELEKKLKEVNDTTIDSKAKLEEQLKNLGNASASLNKEAGELTKALRGDKKAQGNWAELKLKRIFELQSWAEGTEYSQQEYHKTEENGKQYTDYIIKLPDDRRIVIDCKNTLNSWNDYMNEEDEAKKTQYMKEFVKATKSHIDELDKAEYQKLAGGKLDFVFMFMPFEQAYLEALGADKTLFDYAFQHKVAITTPSMLIPMLRIVDTLWKLDKQNKGVERIVEYANKLYEKYDGVITAFMGIDTHLDKAKEAYNTAFGRLNKGSGNVLGWLEKIRKEGGIPTNKKIAISYDDEEIEESIEPMAIENSNSLTE